MNIQGYGSETFRGKNHHIHVSDFPFLVQISVRRANEDSDVFLLQCHGMFKNWSDVKYSETFKTT